MPNFNLTDEQQKIVEAAQTGQHVIVEAGAGTGKTSTLSAVAEVLPSKRILYLAFSKALQLEASQPGKMPSNVEARTAHSLAYRQFGAPNKKRMSKFPTGRDIATLLRIAPFSYQAEDGNRTVEPRQIGTIVREAINAFCSSADRKVSTYHIVKTGDIPATLTDEHRDRFLAHVLSYAQAAWQQISDPASSFPFMPGRGDACYLKLWSLSDPQLPYDVVLFDEAQDADPAISHVVDIQRNAQKLLVGDRAQAIYGWRGAIDAMSKFEAEHHLFLSQSFRFGQAVADVANDVLAHCGTPLRLTGYEKIDSSVDNLEEPDCILCRTNAGVISCAMAAQKAGRKVGIVGGTKQIEGFVKGANDLMQGQRSDFPELAGYRDWQEVCQAVDSGEASSLGMMVRLVNDYGTHEILEVCRNSVKPEDSDLLVSTAHKAKGLEWDKVKIHNDFKPPKEANTISVAEAMLIYVAVTRAKMVLDDGALHWLADLEADTINAIENDTESEESHDD